MKTNYSLSNRLLALALSILMVMSMFPVSAIAAGDDIYGTVEAITGVLTQEGTGAEITATLAATLDWRWSVGSEPGITGDGWWAGVKVTAPTTMKLEDAKYCNWDGTEDFFKNDRKTLDSDPNQYIYLWMPVNEDILRKSVQENFTYNFTFDWDGDGTYEQTIKVALNANETVLMNGSTQEYPKAAIGYGTLELLTTGATVTNNSTANIGVSYDNAVTVEWVAKDESIGRYQDGWWAGVKVTAPEGIDPMVVREARLSNGGQILKFWDYKDSADTELPHYITMWLPLNDLLNGTAPSRVYGFDWNNDGVFEQNITVSVDASKVKLTQDGAQVYPALGAVTALTGGTVTGSATGKATVHVTDMSLNWSEADAILGRDKGWWAGIKVAAPVGMDATVLQNSVYQTKSSPSGEWSASKSFWANKDSQDSDAEHHIGLWMPLKPETIEYFKTENRNITLWYQFDWDNDGTFEQQVTFSVDPNGNIALNKKDQAGFAFTTPTPADVWVGNGTFQNAVTGGEGDGAVTYAIISGDTATIDAATGELTFTSVGTVTVQATKAADSEGYYNAATAQYTVTAIKNDQNPKFATTAPTALTYAPGLTFYNAVVNVLGGTVTYSIESGDAATIDAATGKLTIVKAGTVTVKANISGDDKYNAAEATYTLTVNKADQPGFAISNAPTEYTWSATPIAALTTVNGLGNGQVVWTITAGDDVASVAADGTITLLKAGTFTISAQKMGDECYNASAVVTATIQVNKAVRTGFAFANPAPAAVTYNDNGNKFTNAVVNAIGDGALTYSIVAGNDVATINAATGELTILKSGSVTVKAEQAADDRYEAAEAIYSLTVNKADQTITFTNKTVNELYGIKEYENTVTDSALHGTGALTYEIVGANTIGAAVDAATGKLTFTDSVDKIGTVEVKVTRAADDCYNACSDTFTLTLAYETAPAVPYTLSGATVNTSGWYTGDVTITAADGYTISYYNLLSTADWAGTVTYSTEGNNTFNVYLKNTATGAITDAIEVTELKIDKTQPEDLSIVYKDLVAETILSQLFFISKQDVAVEFSVEDTVSGVAKMEYSLDGGATYQELTQSGTGKGSITVPAQFRDKIVLRVTDVAGNVITTLDDTDATNDGQTLVVDNIAPEIAYTLTGAYNLKDEIIHTKENVFSINYTVTDDNYDLRAANPVVKVNGTVDTTLVWNATATAGTTTLQLTEEGHYDVTVEFTDRSGNVAEVCELTVYVDRTAPKTEVTYSNTNLKDQVIGDPATIAADTISRQTMATPAANTRFVYDGDVVATVVVEEINFYSEDIVILVDGVAVTPDGAWTSVGTNKWQNTVTVSAEGDHVITVENYADRAGNATDWTSGEFASNAGTGTYTSNVHTIDKTKPVITVAYDNNTVANGSYYNADRTATVTVVDRNFRPNETVLTVTDVDAAGQDVSYTAPDVTGWDAWTYVAENTWQTTLPFAVDANYAVSVEYTDIAKYDADAYTAAFTVDKVKPADLSISYKAGYANLVEEIIDKVTFGVLYYGSATEITMEATDVTSGMDYFVVNAKQSGSDGATTINLPVDLKIGIDGNVISGTQGDVSNIKVTNENGKMVLTFTVPKEFRGEFTFTAVDKANYTNSADDNKIVVVDAIAPTRTVTFEPTRMVSTADMKDVATYAESAAVVMYYNTAAVATIRVEEANFYADDIVLTVNGNAVATDKGWINVKDKDNKATDIWEATVTLVEEGDYVLGMTYTDRSKNEMVKYESQRIVIDKTAPVINVVYGNEKVINTVDGRKYFDAKQTATITVTEKNFRADDVKIQVTAKNVIGEAVLELDADGFVKVFSEKGKNRTAWTAFAEGTWRRDDNKYVLTLAYDADANYTFDVVYEDLAANAATDYTADLFTVDTTAPTDLKVTYGARVADTVLDKVSFGYFGGKTVVTISAVDETSGIFHFLYSYANSAGVSTVNKELLDQAIAAADITYDGKTATATFTVPKDNGQFNGNINFTAYDRAENSAALQDGKRVVVDTISPTATITYNAPVQTVDGVAYYDGNITATISINEANFDSRDVQVTVTRNNVNYPVNVTWTNLNVDSHTGTFTLTEDGDYTVNIQYRDKSGNAMPTHTSNPMTLDTTAPEITVAGIAADSANKDEKVGFVITVNDINLDVDSMNPILTAVVQGEDGLYTRKTINLGEPVAVVEGQTYTYTVENLTEDALYTLSYEARDLALNVTNTATLDDGEVYGQVRFSVNREGSTFGFGDEYAEKLVDQYYVYEVYNDIIIVEVNVDPIEEYKVMLNGKELTEGVDYVSEQVTEAGKWSKRTYVIGKGVFAEEGEYNLIVCSTDKAETTAYSDIKDLAIAFVVDKTAPMITVSGLASNGRYQTDAQTVTLMPTDEGGLLYSLQVLMLDSSGRPLKDDAGNDISVLVDLSGEELLKYLEDNGGKVTFLVPEGLNNQVQIICKDCAVNAEGQSNTYDETFTKVTVSQNQLVIFYANKPLWYGTLAGTASIIAIIIALIKRKKAKV